MIILKNTKGLMTSADFYRLLGEAVGRSPKTIRNHYPVKAVGYRYEKGRCVHYFNRSQLEKQWAKLRKNPPVGRGRPRKEKA